MLVTTESDFVKQVTLSPNAPEMCSFESGAHLAHILSSALYKYPITAALRETICNAWDAHLIAGKGDIPIKITLDDAGKYVLRDFGSGIPKRDIASRYGTYGASTKRDSILETGGWGLGCKSPWAVVEHFDVETFCEGEHTFYKANKVTAAVGGMPSLQPLYTLPTTETGMRITIEFPFNTVGPRTLKRLIQAICLAGDINCEYNGEILPRLSLEDSNYNYVLTTEDLFPDNPQVNIFLRYGAVIYPVENHTGYMDAFNVVRANLNLLKPPTQQEYRVVLQAQPDTITLLPSREGLNLQPATVETVKGLLEDMSQNFATKARQNIARQLVLSELKSKFHDCNDQYSLQQAAHNLFTYWHHGFLTGSNNISTTLVNPRIQNCVSYNRAMLGSREREQFFPGISTWERHRRIPSMIEASALDKQLLKSLQRAYAQYKPHMWPKQQHALTDVSRAWFPRNISYPLLKALEDTDVNINNLRVYHPHVRPRNGSYYRRESEKYTLLSRFNVYSVSEVPNFLTKVVLLAHNMREIEESNFCDIVSDVYVSARSPILTYVVSRKVSRKESAIKAFKAAGYTVLDACQEMGTLSQTTLRTQNSLKPRKVGIPLLKHAYTLEEDGKRYTTNNLCNTPVELRTLKPEAVILKSQLGMDHTIIGFPPELTEMVFRKYALDIAVVMNCNQLTAYLNKGVKTFEEFLAHKLVSHCTGSKTIFRNYAFNPEGIHVPAEYTRGTYTHDGTKVTSADLLQKLHKAYPDMGWCRDASASTDDELFYRLYLYLEEEDKLALQSVDSPQARYMLKVLRGGVKPAKALLENLRRVKSSAMLHALSPTSLGAMFAYSGVVEEMRPFFQAMRNS